MEMAPIFAAIGSTRYIAVRRRVFRQLIAALISEQAIQPECERLPDGTERFTIYGADEIGRKVCYVCEGARKLSFGRIRLSTKPVCRMAGEEEQEADDPARFLYETAERLPAAPALLVAFVDEIVQTLLKDAMAEHGRRQYAGTAMADDCDELEGGVTEGHPYHPCYKSRIGFNLHDNGNYGPEFKGRFKLQWIAVRRELAQVSLSESTHYETWIGQELGPANLGQFADRLRAEGKLPEQYLYMPVHPWQWRKQAAALMLGSISNGEIVLLGEGEDEYTAQQSIRTLSNRTNPFKANVKLALSIVNTSSLRTLSGRHVRNGPIVSDRLRAIIESDRYLREEQPLILLREIVGISVQAEWLTPSLRDDSEGMLGAIWRESIHQKLASGEEAVPYTVLCHLRADGRPWIDGWVQKEGLEVWLSALLSVTLQPLLHLLYAHGVALEAHAQNLLLVHRDGIPCRLAARDFSGGVLLYKAVGANADLYPETDRPHEVRDVFHNALFFINLTELALFLEQHYGYEERVFWQLVASGIDRYCDGHPELAEQFRLYDLFAETAEIGQLAKRRLFGGSGQEDQRVPNVLSIIRTRSQGGEPTDEYAGSAG